LIDACAEHVYNIESALRGSQGFDRGFEVRVAIRVDYVQSKNIKINAEDNLAFAA